MLPRVRPLSPFECELFVSKVPKVLLPLLLLITAFPSIGAELSIQYEVIARSGVTAIPDGVGTFTGFGDTPAIDANGNIVFTGGGVDQGGIYTFIGSQHQKVADMNTLMPSGGGATFTDFSGSQKTDIDGGRVAFMAYNSSYDLGLFSNVGQTTPNDLAKIIMIDDNEWSVGGDPWVDGNTVAMYGNRLIPTQHYTTLLWDGSNLSTSFVDPGTGYNVAYDTQASISDNAVIFVRFSPSSYEIGISNNGVFEVLAVADSTPMPGLDGVILESFYSFPVIDQGGQDAAFLGYGNQQQGLFKRVNGGALENVADNTTVMPGSNGEVFKTISESNISLTNGQMVLMGFGQFGLTGIYTDIGGGLSVVVDEESNNTIIVDGETVQVSNLDLGTKSFAYTQQGYEIVFRARFQSGEYAIIRATINTSSDTLFKGGFER